MIIIIEIQLYLVLIFEIRELRVSIKKTQITINK